MDIRCQSEGNISTVSLYEDAASQLSVRWSYESFATEEEQQEYRNIYGQPMNTFVDNLSTSTTNTSAKKSYDSGNFSLNYDLEEEIRKYETAVRKIEDQYACLGKRRRSLNLSDVPHKHPLSKNLFNKITKRINNYDKNIYIEI